MSVDHGVGVIALQVLLQLLRDHELHALSCREIDLVFAGIESLVWEVVSLMNHEVGPFLAFRFSYNQLEFRVR